MAVCGVVVVVVVVVAVVAANVLVFLAGTCR